MIGLGIVNLLLVAVAGLADFWRWEYNYGHELNPEAAIIVPGMSYQPPSWMHTNVEYQCLQPTKCGANNSICGCSNLDLHNLGREKTLFRNQRSLI